MDIEEIHTILKGATCIQHHMATGKYDENIGSDFNLTLHWFKKCGIVEEMLMTETLFMKSYERVAPNRENLTMAQMIVLFGILARDTNKPVEYYTGKFELVKDEIINEIRSYWREMEVEEYAHVATLTQRGSFASDYYFG